MFLKISNIDRTTWLVGLGYTIGISGPSAAFWIVEALVKAGRFDLESASRMVALETAAMGAGMILVSPIIHRIAQRFGLMIGIGLVLLAQGLSLIADTPLSFGLGRMLSGLAFGLIFSIIAAAGSKAEKPEKTFAAAGAMQLVICSGLNPLLGYSSERFGTEGVLGALAVWCVILAIPVIAFAPRVHRSQNIKSISPTGGGNVRLLAVVGVLVVMTLFSMANGSVSNFMAVIPASFGLTGSTLGVGLSVVSLVGALGGVAANTLGTRIGRVIPLFVGLLVFGLSSLWVMQVQTPATYYAAYTTLVISYIFIQPYILGLAAAIDPKGRVASATASALIIVGAGAAWGAAAIATRYGFAAVGWIALILSLVAACVAIILGVNVARHERAQDQFDRSPIDVPR